MKKFFAEFKKFITRGNVVDMAVGVIVGGAFTAIVNGLSNFILKPIVNFVIATVMFWITGTKKGLTEIYTYLGEPAMKDVLDKEGNIIGSEIDLANSYYIDWGSFINAIINFILIALVLFCIVRVINNVKEGKTIKPGKYSKEDKKAMKAQGIKLSDKEAVDAYFAKKAEDEAKAKAEADEKARLEREANPTTEDLLKKILAVMETK